VTRGIRQDLKEDLRMARARFPVWIGVTIVALVVTANAAPRQKGPVDTGPGTLAAARKYLEGRWRLLSFEILPPGGTPIRVLGAGTLTYDAIGNLNVEIRVDRTTAQALDVAGFATTQGALSTRGPTVLDLQARTLTYVLEGQVPLGAPSGPLALNRPRHWQVEGNVLTLTTKGEDGQPVSIGRWEKAP
jgi:hypothetical protein